MQEGWGGNHTFIQSIGKQGVVASSFIPSIPSANDCFQPAPEQKLFVRIAKGALLVKSLLKQRKQSNHIPPPHRYTVDLFEMDKGENLKTLRAPGFPCLSRQEKKRWIFF